MRSTYSQFALYSVVAFRLAQCAPVDLKARQLPGTVQPPVPFDPERFGAPPGSTTQINHGLDDEPAQIPGSTNDVQGWLRDDDPTAPVSDGVNGFPPPTRGDFNGASTDVDPLSSVRLGADGVQSPNSGVVNAALPNSDPSVPLSRNFNDGSIPGNTDNSGLPPNSDPSVPLSQNFNDGSIPGNTDSGALPPNSDPSVPLSQNFNDGSIPGNADNGALPASDNLDLQSLFTGNPEEDQPLSEILQGLQEVQTFPVNEDGTLSDDDIDDLKDTLKDEEKQVEELVDEGRLSKAQGKLLQAEIDPLKTGLDRIDDISIDTGDRIVGAGKTVASVVNPVAGAALSVLDEIGVLEPVGDFLGDAFDATLGKIFKA